VFLLLVGVFILLFRFSEISFFCGIKESIWVGQSAQELPTSEDHMQLVYFKLHSPVGYPYTRECNWSHSKLFEHLQWFSIKM